MERNNLIKAGLIAFFAMASSVSFAACDPKAPGACTDMLLDTTTTWDGTPMHYVRTTKPVLTVRTIQFSPTTYNAWHFHEAPVYVYVMSGDFEVISFDDRGKEKRAMFHAGDAFNEVVDTTHRGGNPSASNWTKILIMTPSEVNCPFMTPADSKYYQCRNGIHNLRVRY